MCVDATYTIIVYTQIYYKDFDLRGCTLLNETSHSRMRHDLHTIAPIRRRLMLNKLTNGRVYTVLTYNEYLYI